MLSELDALGIGWKRGREDQEPGNRRRVISGLSFRHATNSCRDKLAGVRTSGWEPGTVRVASIRLGDRESTVVLI
jgi:hypothetical protein